VPNNAYTPNIWSWPCTYSLIIVFSLPGGRTLHSSNMAAYVTGKSLVTGVSPLFCRNNEEIRPVVGRKRPQLRPGIRWWGISES
jgi:hypothetical protein